MSLIGDFATTAAALPNKVALITEKNQMSYEEMLHLVHTLDMQLATRGVRPGQTLVLWTDRAEVNLAFALLLSLRSLTVIYADPASVAVAGIAHDRVVVTEDGGGVARDRLIVIESDWFATMGTLPAPDYSGASGPGGVFVTRSSGSTGRQKFVRFSEADRLANIRNGAARVVGGLRARRHLATMASNTGAALNANLVYLLAGGSTVALGADLDKILQYVDLYRVDTLGTTPAVISRILAMPEAPEFLSSLRDVRISGAVTAPGLLSAFAKLCDAEIHLVYGAAETGTVIHARYDRDAPPPAGYLGEFMREDYEVVFFDEAMSLQPGATEGIVGFRPRGRDAADLYLSADTEPVSGVHQGCFVPGDIMRREGDSMFLIGRAKNIINHSGNKYALEMIQAALEAAYPGATFAPVADIDAEGLEQLALAYRAQAELPVAGLKAALQARFPGLPVGRILRLQEMPATATGKVDFPAVRALLQGR